MRFFWLFLSTTVTIGLISILNMQLTSGKAKTPRLGLFLSPQKGFWQNAEPANVSFDGNVKMKGLSTNADVYFDDRLVPHIYAQNNADAYYVQGYIHAKFRLWQMEFQTDVAAGRLCEKLGQDSSTLSKDRFFRRLGMVYAAENALRYMMEDDNMKQMMNAYTAGVNAYISTMHAADIPFEYKLLDYKPEPWTNLKTALFLKLMSYDLTGQDNDILQTNGKTFYGYEDFMKIYPNTQDSLDPIIPKGTAFAAPGITVKKPFNVDSGYLLQRDEFTIPRPTIPHPENGSNNWAVDSSKTKSKRPILCNDPHLGLNLPSLWYEMQITTPEYSAYGATFPGSPAIIIGFNNNIAWGVTNAGRDVKDYYELQFKDSTMKEYQFNTEWRPSEMRKEVIKFKGGKDSLVENIALTDFGIVMYDKKYKSSNEDSKYFAVRWTAHDPSNELLTFIKLNAAKNYDDYKAAISSYECPGQNFIFAAKAGDVAITQQGKFVAKWEQQGDFVMKGVDSSFMWQGFIPYNENPQMHNPERGFVSSANQKSVDSTYPYYLGRASNFPPYRGFIINRKLSQMNHITVDDMKELQTDNYNVFAETARPILLKYINENKLDADGKKYLGMLKDWNLNNAFDEKGATIFQLWWDSLDAEIFFDDEYLSRFILPKRTNSALVDNLLHDSTYKFIENIMTSDKETIYDVVNIAFEKAKKQLAIYDKKGTLAWGKHQDTYVNHLTRALPQLSRLHLNTSGAANCINSVKDNHGPSWRMIVHLTDDVEAYGVYPGGQSGNPGSRFYDNFVDTWAKGQYNTLLLISKDDVKNHKKIKWHINFTKA
ncbi:MAG: penicillin acylase family protein [Chitinophagaceae bacterium]